MKRFILIFLLFNLFLFASCASEQKGLSAPKNFLPKETEVVFDISDWQSFYHDVENNTFLHSYSETPVFSHFQNHKTLFANLHPVSGSLLCFSTGSEHSFTFLSVYTEKILQIDSIQNKTSETLKIGEKEIQRIVVDKNPVFSAVKDSVYIISSSQEVLLDLLDRKTQTDPEFQKLFELQSKDSYIVFVKEQDQKKAGSFFSWSRANLTLTQESIHMTGITVATDSVPQLLKIFKDQDPQQSNMAEIVPISANRCSSITFNDSEKLQTQLAAFRKEKSSPTKTGIFDSSSEVGIIEMSAGNAFFIKSIDPTVTQDALASHTSAEATFRETPIKSIDIPNLFSEVFSPLFPKSEVFFVFALDDFFVFAPTIQLCEDIIISYLNQNTLKNSSQFNMMNSKISSAPSLMTITLDGTHPDRFQALFIPQTLALTEKKASKKYPIAVQQYIADRNFAHFSFYAREFSEGTKSDVIGVNELYHIDLKAPVITQPLFYEGHAPQVVVQDAENTLYLISESGKIIWNKSLESPILGTIEFVDLHGNGNRHMVFVTQKTLHVIDRNGKDAAGFPLRFKDDITQPVAVFDYENKRDYRFFLIQDKKVLLYDGKGKPVKGFSFSGTKSSIIQPVSHIRMGNKDYILIAEQNGKLNILNRMGQTRVEVKKAFNFSRIPLTYEDNHFVVITLDHSKERISEKGEVSSLKLNVSDNYWFVTEGSTKATLDDNNLRINGKLIELPLGIYSEPVLLNASQKMLSAITEIQEKKVYLFDHQNQLIEGFPVFGSSVPSFAGKSGQVERFMVVRGDESGIIVYHF